VAVVVVDSDVTAVVVSDVAVAVAIKHFGIFAEMELN
jgi:hypothetical protein